MDKFGIFNLLNSLLTPSKQNSPDGASENSPAFSAPTDFLSGILNSFSNQTQKKDEPPLASNPTPVKKDETPKLAPLQSKMLCTISTHDQIITRINSHSKNDKPSIKN